MRLTFSSPLLTLMASTLLALSNLSTGHAADRVLVEWQTQQLSDVFFSEGATAGDINRDGHADIVSGPVWYEGPGYQTKHLIYEPKPFNPLGYSNNFFCYVEDFNGDDWIDVLVYGFPGQDASWFENPKGREGFWERHIVMDVVDNESPQFVDINGDGKRDIVCSTGGFFGFAEINREDPTAKWTFHRISDKSAGGRFTHGLGTGDVNGDGRLDLLEKNGWWEQPESLKGDPLWKKHAVQFSGPGGAQMFAYDFDGDGDNDVLTSLAAHGFGLAWYENRSNDPTIDTRDGDIPFQKHEILAGDGWRPNAATAPSDPRLTGNPYGVNFAQLHAVDLADIDGDGLKDIVTGKRYWAHGPKGDAEPDAPPVLYWFRTVRNKNSNGKPTVGFVPYLIDDASGVGVEVKALDVNGDDALDIVVGNKKGTFVSTQQRRTVSDLDWQRAQPLRFDQAARSSTDGLPQNEGLQPEDAAKAITVPAGFAVQLAAGEPLVHQPVAFTIDHRGRLWVAEAYTYPQRAADGEGKDRIIILEDKDLDGSFESRKVFIEGLNLVSGLEVGFGGVWVGAAPYLMFIPDRDGDDVPDQGQGARAEGEGVSALPFPNDVPAGATVLLDGFGWQDTHETLNAFIWGPDGWLYGCHGVFTHSKVGKPGTPDEQRQGLNAGVWRYHPMRHELEVFAHGSSNPWGVDFNDHGQTFITACVIPHLFHMIQGARYHRQGGQHFNPHTYDDIKTIADHAHYAGNIRDHAWWGRNEAASHNDTHAAGGGHAHCGAMIYLGDNWPTRYRNTLFMSNIHGNRINNDLLVRKGSGFVGTHGRDFLFANDRWFRGINLKYGPDGSVYLIDWYDKNACHRHQPEIWDRTNGRIYRVTFGDQKPKRVDLSTASDDELVDLQLHENDWYVRMGRRLLMERGAATSAEKLREIALSGRSVPQRLRGLWALHATNGVDAPTTLKLLSESGRDSEYLRAWAIQLDLENGAVSEGAGKRLHELAVSDPSPVVRLYLASALQRLPLEQRWPVAEALLAHVEDTEDHNLPLLIWYGVEPLVPHNPGRALALASASKLPIVSRFIYRRAASESESLKTLLVSLGKTDSLETQRLILEEITSVVRTRGRLEMPQSWPDVYRKLAKSMAEEIRSMVQFITVKFGDKSIFPALRGIVTDAKLDAQSRLQALDALLNGNDPELPPLLHKLLDDAAIRGAALRGLARYAHPKTAKEILSRYAKLAADERADAIATLASRTEYALELLQAIEKKAVARTDLSAFTVGQMRRLKDDRLIEKLNEVWGNIRSTPAEKQKLIAEFKDRLTPEVLSKADLPQGRAVFAKTCAKCHRLFGEGGQIGPDITGSNRANIDYILTNILDPSAVVGRDYQMTTVITNGGRVVSGLIKEENESAVVLQTVNEVVVVDKSDIDERALTTTSMMPDGQLQQMQPDEARDLIAYLASPSQVPLPGAGPVYDEKTGRVAGALEGESLKVLSKTAGGTSVQGMGGFKADRWSDAQLWWTGAKPGARLVLELPVKSSGQYEIFAVMTKARDYGIVQLSLDDAPLGKPIDLFNSPDVITTGVVSLGTLELSGGNHQFGIQVTGANPDAAKAYMFGLDYLYLARKAEDETATDTTAK
ncbi:c-type cytochrome [bacterium]|nr:c-type cytochrome [bacterium]